MSSIQRIRVLDAPVDVIDMDRALEFVDQTVQAGQPGNYILAMNPEKTFALKKDAEFDAFLENASLLLPDGIGIVLAARLLHGARMGRVAGADLMQEMCRHAAAKGHRIFIYGAQEDVSRLAAARLLQRYPGLQIVGRAHGYIPVGDMEDLVDRINESRADILFVALGSPRQEHWMREYGPGLKAPLCLGIGGTLDTIAGRVRRAPLVFRRLGMEWFFRLLCQPSRIGRQRRLPVFAWAVFRERLRRKKPR